jgi:hypothetical protein
MKRITMIFIAALFIFAACENVEDGYRIEYSDSPSSFLVTLQTPDRAAIGDSITYLIKAESDVDIKTLIVTTSVSGGDGTGFETVENGTDPLIDHLYGTIQPGTRSIELYYHYVVSQDTLDATVEFTLIDNNGKNDVSYDLFTIPSTIKYENISLYAKNNSLADGLSTSDGTVYYNTNNYSDVSAVNQAVQESLDIVFLMDGTGAILAAPYSGYFWSSMSVKNKTLFKLIGSADSIDFNNLTDADVSKITEDAVVKKGSTQIGDIKVGNIIGFRTDFASTNPYHYGLIKINGMHPTNVDHYEGSSYVIEMDIITQK